MVSIDLRLLRHAQALAEHGSFSRAAEALDIAQPSLSRGIKDLESRVGQPLFRFVGHLPGARRNAWNCQRPRAGVPQSSGEETAASA
jgi:hypothetical protein